ncbi:MAG: hypothetical protein FWD31_07240 [Planctomycetaceae bacterium]|nr:hypothetical protein [Planctomycetaceae bacterium]
MKLHDPSTTLTPLLVAIKLPPESFPLDCASAVNACLPTVRPRPPWLCHWNVSGIGLESSRQPSSDQRKEAALP